MIAQRPKSSLPRRWRVTLTLAVSAAAGCGLVAAAGPAASAHARFGGYFLPGNLLVSRTVYVNRASIIVPGVTQLPPGCTAGNCVTATADGTYPTCSTTTLADASFGVTAPIFLDQCSLPSGDVVQTIQVPNSSDERVKTNGDQMVTSFSSKSEIGAQPVDPAAAACRSWGTWRRQRDRRLQLQHARRRRSDQSGAISRITAWWPASTSSASSASPRPMPIAATTAAPRFSTTPTAPMSIYTAGNAGNGGNPQPNGVILGAGAQIITPSHLAPEQVEPGHTDAGRQLQRHRARRQGRQGRQGHQLPRPHRLQQRGLPDQGQRQQRRQHGVLHRHLRLRNGSRRLPHRLRRAEPGGAAADLADRLQPVDCCRRNGVFPYNMCVLQRLLDQLAKTAHRRRFPVRPVVRQRRPRCMWLTRATATPPSQPPPAPTPTPPRRPARGCRSGCSATANSWPLAYTLQAGLNLGMPYTVQDYPTGDNAATGLPWAPATDGLRNITGRVNRDGTVTIWAHHLHRERRRRPGRRPEQARDDHRQARRDHAAGDETFSTVRTAKSGEVLRGVSFTPGTRSGF